MKTISIVHSDLQLMNCIEAVSHYKADKNIILLASLTKRNDKMKYLLDKYSNGIFDRVVNLQIVRKQNRIGYHLNFLYAIFVTWTLTLFSRYDFFFIGNYMEYIQRYLLYLGYQNDKRKVVLVDDGTATLRFVTLRRKEFLTGFGYFDRSVSFFARFIPLCKRKAQIPSSLIFFTAYKLDNILDCDKIERNNYQVIKKFRNGSGFDEGSFFTIGQPLIESNVITKEDYLDILQKILAISNTNNNYYCPHPEEKNVESISQLGFHILNSMETFEIVAMSIPSSSKVIGFYSSALLNVKHLRNDIDVSFVNISNFVDEKYKVNASLELTYSYISKNLRELKIF
jgi:hypothetical protein